MDVCRSSAFCDISKFIEFSDSKEFFGIIDYNVSIWSSAFPIKKSLTQYPSQHSVYRISIQCPEYPLMKNARVKVFKDLVDFTVDYDESDEIGEFLIKFSTAANLCNEGMLIL